MLVLSLSPTFALAFNITYDSSTSTAPAGFFTAFNYVAALYENAFSDPITINLQVGWGKINGANLGDGNRAQTANFQLPLTFAQVRDALSRDAKSISDRTSTGSLPVADPVGASTSWVLSRSEAKAVGLLAGNDRNIQISTGLPRPDGYIGFMNDAASYTFDPNRRAVAGKYDFIGIASHEITELMGRYGQGQTIPGGHCPLDLFRFLSPGVRDLALANSGAYFSIDGGFTAINTFRGKLGGDPSDWLGATADSYNAVASTGQILAISPGDLTAMDVIGYDVPSLPLSVSFAGNEVLVSWPATIHSYHLETSPSLDSGGQWNPVAQTPASVGSQWVVTNRILITDAFYRLTK